MHHPITYKMIPVQHAFFIKEDGEVQITQLTKIPKTIKLGSVKEAREFIRNYTKLL